MSFTIKNTPTETFTTENTQPENQISSYTERSDFTNPRSKPQPHRFLSNSLQNGQAPRSHSIHEDLTRILHKITWIHQVTKRVTVEKRNEYKERNKAFLSFEREQKIT